MADARFPVDLLNPGQVFACLGFLELADLLIGEAKGGFVWQEGSPQAEFQVMAQGVDNPVAVALNFLADAPIAPVGPHGWKPPDKKQKDGSLKPDPIGDLIYASDSFPDNAPDVNSLPIRLGGDNAPNLVLSSWCDGSSRKPFKLYSGNRSAFGIVSAMLAGVRKKPSKKHPSGEVVNRGLAQLLEDKRDLLLGNPLGLTTAMDGSFNIDPRGAWTGLGAGYSLNVHKDHQIVASPVVEILGAIGLEHARPVRLSKKSGRTYRYGVWDEPLPTMLARPAFSALTGIIRLRTFKFQLTSSGKNSIVTFATEDNPS